MTADPSRARRSPPRGPGQAGGVDALVLAAGRGERLGLGPKALLMLGGQTLLDRAIAVMRSVAHRIIVGVPDECLEAVRRRQPRDVVVLAGGKTRIETTLRLFHASAAPLIVQHDVVHPFVTPELARRVVAAASTTGAAMAAVRAAEHVYRGEARIAGRIVAAGALWLARKPLAYRRSALVRALAHHTDSPDDVGTADLLLAAGQSIETVAVEPWHIKITSPGDWSLAQALEPLLARGRLLPDRGSGGGA